MFRTAIAAAILLILPLAGQAETETRQIIVTGEGRVTAAPDMAVVTLGVSDQAPEAQTAMDSVSERVRAIFQTVTDYGVAPRDVQTTSLRLDPVWERRDQDEQGPPEIRGFVATNDITLRLRDMTSLGAILQDVLASGANRFNRISFTLSDPTSARNEARREAVRDARARAELYAEAAGVSLGALIELSENGGSAPRPMMLETARMASDSAMPIAGGELDIVSQVRMVYAIAE